MKTIRLMLALLFIGTSLPLMAVGNDTIVLDNVTYARVRVGDYFKNGCIRSYRIFDSIYYQAHGHEIKDPGNNILQYGATRYEDDDYVVLATINTNSLHLLKTPKELVEEYGYGYTPTPEQFEDTRSDELKNVRVRRMVEFDGVPYPVVSVSHNFRYYTPDSGWPKYGIAHTSWENTIIDGDRFGKIAFDNGASRWSLPCVMMCSYKYPQPVTVPLPFFEPSMRVWPVDSLIFPDDAYFFERRYNWDCSYKDNYEFIKYPKHLIKYLRLGRYFIGSLEHAVVDGLLLDDIDLPESPYLNYKKIGNTIFSLDGKRLVFHKRSATEKVEVEEGVTQIGPSAFFNTSFTSVKLPESLKVIGDSAFHSSSIEEVDIYADLIYAFAFANCKNLRKVSLYTNPMIFAEAFWDCPNLKEVYCYTIDPPILCYCYDNGQQAVDRYGVGVTRMWGDLIENRGTFGGCGNDITIYVPKYCSERYQTVKYHMSYKRRPLYETEHDWLCYGDKLRNNSVKIVEMDYVVEGIDAVSAGERLPSVNVIGREVSITGASGSVMAEAFDATGRCVYSGHGSSFTLPSSGIYILRINGSTQKIIVK